MVKYLISSVILLFTLTPRVFADSIIQTGNASAQSTVINQVNGGESYTKIEVEANGEKKVIETNELGTHSISVESNGSKSTVEVKNESNVNKVEINDEDEKTSSEGAKKVEKEEKKTEKNNEESIVTKIINAISDFVKGLFS